MREVSEFIVVFPRRLSQEMRRRNGLLYAIQRRYPQYTFRIVGHGPGDDEEFSVYPMMGRVGGKGDDPDQVYMCKPLDPRVIPEIVAVLRDCEQSGCSVN